MIKGINGSFDDYAISPMIRQVLLYWGYELVESNLLKIFCSYKNKILSIKQRQLREAKNRYHNGDGKEKQIS